MASSNRASPPSARAAAVSRIRVADQVMELLRSRIATGEYPLGTRLPTERELAEEFDVSVPTLREAIRGLSATGLVDVRQGSGAYVVTSPGAILAVPLATLVQLEEIGIVDVLRLLHVLTLHVIDLAADRATDDEIERFGAAVSAIGASRTADEVGAAMNGFFAALGAAGHDPLATSLVSFLGRLVTGLELRSYRSRSGAFWRDWTSDFQPKRQAIVDALTARDAAGAKQAMEDLHRAVLDRVNSVTRLRDVRLSDPALADFVAGLIDVYGKG